MKKTIILDIDDTVVQWKNGFVKWFEDTKGFEPVEGIDVLPYNLEHVYDISVPEITKYIQEFNSSKHFGDLEFFEGAKETLEVLKDEYHLVAVSSCGDGRDTYLERVRNVGSYFNHIHLIPLMHSKHDHIIYHLDDVVFFLDDSLKHVEVARNSGINAFHYGTDINSWYQVYETIKEIENNVNHYNFYNL